jgi:16S rRNA (guanine527-N7)-methyltransferase
LTRSAEIQEGLERLALRYGLDEPQLHRLGVLLDGIAGDPRSPTTVRDPDEALRQHIADSLVGLEVEGLRVAGKIADLGSGAGLPGLVLAIALPDTEVRLVESQAGKCAYIAALSAKLGLRNIRIACTRAEEWVEGIGEHDLVVSRALAAQQVVVEYAAPLLEMGGLLVEWRGRRQASDEAAAARAAEELGLRLLETRKVEPFPGARDRHLHVFEKVATTPGRFPRRAGLARKRPLGG